MEATQNLRFRLQEEGNDTLLAIAENQTVEYDTNGAVFYVVFVVLIYGLSIVMMIASHIRRNKHDSHLRSYLKEMTILRKKNRREYLLEKMTNLALKSGSLLKQKNDGPTTEEETALLDRRFLESNGTSHGKLIRASTSDCDDYVTNIYASITDHDDNSVQTTEL